MNLSNSVIGSLMILNELDLLPRWIFVKLQFDEVNDGREPSWGAAHMMSASRGREGLVKF